MTDEELKRMVLGTVGDLVSDFLYYGRKEDEELTLAEMARAQTGVVTIEEVVEKFREKLTDHWGK